MKKRTLFRNLLVGMTCASALATVNAATQPKFTIIPTTPTSVSVSPNGTATVSYTVTNMTKITRTLVMKPIAGITQDISEVGACSNPFTLAPQQSCALKLALDGNTLPRIVNSGPVICKTQDASNNAPDPFLCSQPTLADSLNINVTPSPLSVTPNTLSLTTGGVSQSIKITSNLLVRTAMNIAADFTGTALEGNVIQNASDCLSLAPGESCNLIFTPELQAVTLTSFPIQGTNTFPEGASIEVVNPASAQITIAPQQLSLQADSAVPQNIVVTNTSNVLTATDITATLSANLIAAGVTVTDNGGCASVAPGDSTCTITFTPGSQPATGNPAITGSAAILGTNTSQVNATITVLPATVTTINFASGSASTLALQINGNPGVMTIQNNGTVPAQGVFAELQNTALSGAILSRQYTVNGITSLTECPNIPVGGTCTLTFTPGSTAVVQPTNFSIYGTNTTTETGTISIGSFAYVTLTGSSTVSLCPLNSNGSLGTCQNSGSSGVAFKNSQGVVLNSARTIAYFANQDAQMVLRCPINFNGTLGACQDSGNSGGAFIQPIGITLNGAGDKAYVTNRNNGVTNGGFVSLCPVNANGSFGVCSNTGTGLTAPSSIALYTYPSAGTKAYIGGRSAVSICNVDSGTGLLSGCGDSGAGNIFSGSQGIALNSAGTRIYVANRNANTVSLCSVSLADGTLSGCTTTGSGFNGPAGIALNSSGNTVYIANIGSSRLSTCSINPDGSFGTCTQTAVSGVTSAIALLQN